MTKNKMPAWPLDDPWGELPVGAHDEFPWQRAGQNEEDVCTVEPLENTEWRSDDDILDAVEADMESNRCISAEEDVRTEREFDLVRPSGYYWLVSTSSLGNTPAVAHWSRDICRWHFFGVDHSMTTAKLAEDGWRPTGVALRYDA